MSGFAFLYPCTGVWLAALPLILVLRRRLGRVRILLVPYASAWQPAGAAPPRDRSLALAVGALLLTILAAARPQFTHERQQVVARGYDLVLAVDLSTSMLAEDYANARGAVNRLDAIRPVIQAFIDGRPADRIAVVVFAGRAYTLSPLTTDHAWLQQRLSHLQIGQIEDGTAIGDGIGIALTHLESHGNDPATGSFIVLLTDGANTGGTLTPPQATLIAAHRKITIFTIGAGRDGLVPYPVFDAAGTRTGTRNLPFGIDEESLRQIARASGGAYFKADDAAAVQTAFAAIDQAEKTRFVSRTYFATTELFFIPLAAALGLLLMAYRRWLRTRSVQPASAA